MHRRSGLPCQPDIDPQGEEDFALPDRLAGEQRQGLPLVAEADQLEAGRKEVSILFLLDYRLRDSDGRFRQVSDQILDGPKRKI